MTNPTDLQTIRDALEYLAELDADDSQEALAALDRIEGMVLPVIPKDYRLYTMDCSIEGRSSVMLSLQGEARDIWFLHDEATNEKANLQLYVSGIGPTIRSAVLCAVKKIGGVG